MYSADAESSTTEIEALDLTYKDAIFDSEIRTCMHSEYSSAQPATDAYSRLFKTIEQHESGSEVAQGSVHQASLPSLFRDSLAAVRLYLGGATLVKVFPSLVALLLVFSALGPSVAALLGTGSHYLGQASSYSRPDFANTALLTSMGEIPDQKGGTGDDSSVYDPNYDAPETWTPIISQNKFASDSENDASNSNWHHRNTYDIRILGAGPQ